MSYRVFYQRNKILLHLRTPTKGLVIRGVMVRRVRRFRWDNDVLLRVNIIKRVIFLGLVWGMEDGLFAWHYYMQAHARALNDLW